MYLYPSRSPMASSKILLIIVVLLLFLPLSLSLQPQLVSVTPQLVPNRIVPQAILQPATTNQIADRSASLRFDPTSQQFVGQHAANQWQIALGQEGLQIQPNDAQWSWNLQLQSYGRAGAMLGVQTPQISSLDQSVVYQWDSNLRELVHTKSAGVKQDFLLKTAPAGSGPLVLNLAVTSALQGQLANGAISFSDASGQQLLSYGGLVVFDALGNTIPARFAFASNQIQLIIEDQAARYPLLIDPLVEQGYLKSSIVPKETTETSTEHFGADLAMDGDTLVIGTRNLFGVAYVFERESNTWTEKAILKGQNKDDNDRFGSVVAISGDTIAIGSPCDGNNGSDSSNDPLTCYGAVYIFTRSGATWSQQAYLKSTNIDKTDFFGSSIALDGDTLVVGTIWEDGDGSNPNNNSKESAGAAYVFTRTGTTWSQQAYLKSPTPKANDFFGAKVSISGDTIAVSAYETATPRSNYDDNRSDTTIGTVYLFKRTGNTWSQQASLKIPNKTVLTWFGHSIALENDTLVVGGYDKTDNTPNTDGNSSVFIFIRNGNTWSQQAQLKASNSHRGDGFGNSIAISGNRIVIGAPYRLSDETNRPDSERSVFGAAYIFTRTGTTWSEKHYFRGSNTGWGDLFGDNVAIDGDYIIVGAPQEDGNGLDPYNNSVFNAGAAYAFFLSPTIALSGKNNYIASSSPLPTLSNGSALPDIQMGGSISQTFRIHNNGEGDLELAGSSFVLITGEHASDFKVVKQPTGRIAPGQSASFIVEFKPSAVGMRKAVVQIQSNDANLPAFSFNIQGASLAHELNSFVHLPIVQK